MDDYEVFCECIKRLEAKHGNFGISVTFSVAVTLVAQLQLALRHPENKGPTTGIVRTFIKSMIAAMEHSEPAIGPILRKGDNPEHDVPRQEGG